MRAEQLHRPSFLINAESYTIEKSWHGIGAKSITIQHASLAAKT
jgi:hypothetical protein